MRANGWTRSVLLAGFMLFTAAAFAEPDLDSRTALVDKLMAELKVVQAEVMRTAKTIEEIDATVDHVIRVDEKDKQQVLAELADKIPLDVHDNVPAIQGEIIHGLRDPVRPGPVTGGGHDGIAPEFLYPVEDTFVIGGNRDVRNQLNSGRLLIDMLDHGFAADIRQRLSLEAR